MPNTPPPLTPATYHILLALAGRDRHGYAILKAVEKAGAIRLGPATLYAALRRLEDTGLIEESAWRPDADLDDDRRRYYRLSGAGRTALVTETDRLQVLVKTARRSLAADSGPA